MGRVVAVVNQKGGVGKTTTSVNLAAALALQGLEVLLVDLDPQANASSGLGVEPQAMGDSVYAALMGAEAASLLWDTEVDRLQLLPSGPDLYAAEVDMLRDGSRYGCLARALLPLRQDYDVILVDCPPSLGVLTLNALCAADSVLIPMQAEYYALEGLTQLTHTLDTIRGTANPDLVIEGVLLTMYDGRNNLAKQVAADVRKHFGRLVYRTVIPRNVRLSEAPGFGRPAVVYDAASRGGEGYLQLAQEFRRRRGLKRQRQPSRQRQRAA